MEFDKVNFMKLIMKTLACTPNQNFDQESYDESVLKPAQNLRELRNNVDNVLFDEHMIVETLNTLKNILIAKNLPDNELHERLQAFNEINGIHPFVKQLS